MNDAVRGRTAVVTAANGTIGRAVVEGLLSAGMVERVLGVDIAPATDVSRLPQGADLLACDLLLPDGPKELLAELPAGVDVLVNVLGGERHPPVRAVDDVAWPPPEVWDDILDLNLSAAYRITRLLLPLLTPAASICNISSIAASMPWAVSPAYGAAKAGLEHWSSSLTVLLADRGIRVNLVRPAFVYSRQWDDVDRPEFEHVAEDRVPLRQIDPNGQDTGREQSPQDVADAVVYLCSPAARQLTGQVINVDGGAALVRAPR